MHRMIAGFVTVLQWKSKEKLPEYGKNRPKQGKLGRFGAVCIIVSGEGREEVQAVLRRLKR